MKFWFEIVRLFKELNRLGNDDTSSKEFQNLFYNKGSFLLFAACFPPLVTVCILTLVLGFSGFFLALFIVTSYMVFILLFLVRPDWLLLEAYKHFSQEFPELEKQVEDLKVAAKFRGDRVEELEKGRDEISLKHEKELNDNKSKIRIEKDRAIKADSERRDVTAKLSKASMTNFDLRQQLSRRELEVEELKLKLSNNEKGYQKSSFKHMNEMTALRGKLQAAKKQNLEDFDLNDLIQHLIGRFSEEEASVSLEKTAVLYGLMQEHAPDQTRLRELSQIPHELQRAQQIELIVERYSEKITDVERSELSETEKRDKINAYRLARERELGIEG